MKNKKSPTTQSEQLTVCFLEGCPQASRCTRRLAYEQSGNKRQCGSAVHPSSLHEDGCDMFCEARLKRYAKGATHLYDEVRMKHYGAIRQQVARIFRSRDIYYRSFNGNRLITESEQEQICRLFASYGYPTTGLFNEFVEQY
ncbi:MAG: hypothetical protein K2N13_05525 [Paraprevotella sp.]|nr:hypothetical protein [Paraprevotella sp.]